MVLEKKGFEKNLCPAPPPLRCAPPPFCVGLRPSQLPRVLWTSICPEVCLLTLSVHIAYIYAHTRIYVRSVIYGSFCKRDQTYIYSYRYIYIYVYIGTYVHTNTNTSGLLIPEEVYTRTCTIMRSTATHCNTLQHTATH